MIAILNKNVIRMNSWEPSDILNFKALLTIQA